MMIKDSQKHKGVSNVCFAISFCRRTWGVDVLCVYFNMTLKIDHVHFHKVQIHLKMKTVYTHLFSSWISFQRNPYESSGVIHGQIFTFGQAIHWNFKMDKKKS